MKRARPRFLALASAASLAATFAALQQAASADDLPIHPSAAPVSAGGGAERPAAPGEPPREVGSPPPPSETGNGFAFGSYGRIGIGIDGAGHEGYPVNVVSHGSRLEETPYLELDLYYGGQLLGGRWRAVLAPAFGGDLFHYTGTFESHFALRNAYVEVEDYGARGLRFWAGSRMYRGDDMYLFDYWPLDNLNTVGAGAGYHFSDRHGENDIAIHGGLNRLDDPFQIQTQAVPPRGLETPANALTLDRPRSVGSLKYTRYFGGHNRPGGTLAGAGAKLSLYGEVHYLPDGQQVIQSQARVEALPSQIGWVAGAQLGMWLRPYTFLNVWLRYAGGLGAYGDLALPTTTDVNKSVQDARELVAALSLNYETRHLGVMASAYLRSFTDPDTAIPLNPNSYVEGAVAVRPQVYLTNWLHVAVELSYQQRSYAGFDPYLDRRLAPKVYRASVMPIISPLGRGTYSRPILYAVYTLSSLDQDARDVLFDPTDVRYASSSGGLVHYVGVGAEWWFQSSYR